MYSCGEERSWRQITDLDALEPRNGRTTASIKNEPPTSQRAGRTAKYGILSKKPAMMVQLSTMSAELHLAVPPAPTHLRRVQSLQTTVPRYSCQDISHLTLLVVSRDKPVYGQWM